MNDNKNKNGYKIWAYKIEISDNSTMFKIITTIRSYCYQTI